MSYNITNRRMLITSALASGAAPTGTTWNPSDISGGSLSNGNLTFTNAGGGTDSGTRAIVGKTAGKWYFEATWTGGAANADSGVGIANLLSSLPTVAFDATNGMLLYHSGNLWFNGSQARVGATSAWSSGTTVGVAVDFGTSTMWVTINGSTWSGGSGTPAAGTGGDSFFAIDGSAYYPIVTGTASGNDVWVANFSGTGTVFSVPSGFTGTWA